MLFRSTALTGLRVIVLLSVLPLFGCNKPEESASSAANTPAAPATVPTAKNYEEQAKQIQDNPNLPESLKQIQLQAAKERFGPGASGVKPGAAVPK